MSQGTPNPQINISKIPGGAGIAGALFALSTMLNFLIGIPRIRLFFVAAVILGCGVALVLRLIHRETPGKPWILPAIQDADGPNQRGPVARSQERRDDVRRKLRAFAAT